MKLRKHVTLLLAMLMLVQCIAVAPAAAAGEDSGTKLYDQLATESAGGCLMLWPSNSSVNYHHQLYADDGVTYNQFGYYNNRADDGTGLPEGETMAITVPNVELKTADWGEMELTFYYSLCEANSDINIGATGSFWVYASTDGGRTWSKGHTEMKSDEFIGFGKTSNGLVSERYKVTSTDLAGLVKKGDVINALLIKPYGDFDIHYGATRILGISVTGYKDKAPAAPIENVEYIQMNENLIRQIVVEQAYKIADRKWTTEKLVLTDNHGTPLNHDAGYQYRGPVYVGTGIDSSWEMYDAAHDGLAYKGGLTSKDAIGMQCINFVAAGIQTITGMRMQSIGAAGYNAILVGGLTNEPYTSQTDVAIGRFKDQEVFEAYAQLKPGDFMTNTGHARLVTVSPVVVRNADGSIDPDQSYVKLTETAGANRQYWLTADGKIKITNSNDAGYIAQYQKAYPDYTFLYATTMRVDQTYRFGVLYDTAYLPFTLKEYSEGKIQAAMVEFKTPKADDNQNVVAKGFKGIVTSNYYLAETVVTLSKGDEVLFTAVENWETHDYAADVSSTALDAKLATLGAGTYKLTVDVQSGPVTTILGKPPVTRVYEIDFTV